VAELDDVRAAIRKKLGIGDRRLRHLIQQYENETLLPRRLAILLLARDNKVPIHKHASEDDLSQLRAVRAGAGATGAPPASSPPAPAPAPKKRSAPTPRPTRPRKPTRGRKVFVVHGRNEALRKNFFSFLRSLDLEPLEWRKAIQAAGKGTPTVGDIIEAAFKEAVAVVVLLTPDDEVKLADEFQKPGDAPYEKRVVRQARPNVLFEAGMAFGREPNSTVLVQVGEVKPFSDVGGRHVTRLTNDVESRSELVTKLRNAGCAVKDDGADWYSEGDFSI
jgi:predicted nucleotide-binding protein